MIATYYNNSDLREGLALYPGIYRWAVVDDLRYGAVDDADYLYILAGLSNYYIGGYTGPTIPSGSTISSVRIWARLWLTNMSSPLEQYAYLRIGEDDYPSDAAIGIADAFSIFYNTSATWTTNPATDSSWLYDDLADIAGFGVGISTGADTTVTKCSSLYMEIAYLPPDASPPGGWIPRVRVL